MLPVDSIVPLALIFPLAVMCPGTFILVPAIVVPPPIVIISVEGLNPIPFETNGTVFAPVCNII